MRKKFTAKAPRFRTGKPGRSPYYWWWEYLRRNEDYLKCCADGGAGPMANLYKDFGDVRGDFKSWWRSTGEDLFCEPPSQSLHIVDQQHDHITVFVPLSLGKGSIRRRFKHLLNTVHTRKKGGRVFAHSLARYPLSTKPVPTALEKALRVYDVWRGHRKKNRRDKNGWTLWQIGEAANVAPGLHTKPNDVRKDRYLKQTAMAVTVKRYVKAAEGYIKNVGKGKFPLK